MRKHGIAEPYEKLKTMTRGEQLQESRINELIDQLDLGEDIKDQIRQLSPASYIGEASRLVEQLLSEISD